MTHRFYLDLRQREMLFRQKYFRRPLRGPAAPIGRIMTPVSYYEAVDIVSGNFIVDIFRDIYIDPSQ